MMNALARFASRLSRHPGLDTLAIMVCVGMFAGVSQTGRLADAMLGAGLMLAVFGPVVLATLPPDKHG